MLSLVDRASHALAYAAIETWLAVSFAGHFRRNETLMRRDVRSWSRSRLAVASKLVGKKRQGEGTLKRRSG
jgi:hypothetical protein